MDVRRHGLREACSEFTQAGVAVNFRGLFGAVATGGLALSIDAAALEGQISLRSMQLVERHCLPDCQ